MSGMDIKPDDIQKFIQAAEAQSKGRGVERSLFGGRDVCKLVKKEFLSSGKSITDVFDTQLQKLQETGKGKTELLQAFRHLETSEIPLLDELLKTGRITTADMKEAVYHARSSDTKEALAKLSLSYEAHKAQEAEVAAAYEAIKTRGSTIFSADVTPKKLTDFAKELNQLTENDAIEVFTELSPSRQAVLMKYVDQNDKHYMTFINLLVQQAINEELAPFDKTQIVDTLANKYSVANDDARKKINDIIISDESKYLPKTDPSVKVRTDLFQNILLKSLSNPKAVKEAVRDATALLIEQFKNPNTLEETRDKMMDTVFGLTKASESPAKDRLRDLGATFADIQIEFESSDAFE